MMALKLSEAEIRQVSEGVMASAGHFGVLPGVQEATLQALRGEITFEEAIEQAAVLARD